MRRKSVSVALAVCGAVIGAGFASGREICAFFARYGEASLLAMLSAVAVIGGMVYTALRRTSADGLPQAWRGTWWEACWRALFALLLMVTGGAMLSGSGEIAALLLPMRGAKLAGMAVTMAFAAYATWRDWNTLPFVSAALVVCMVGMMVLGLRLPVSGGAAVMKKASAVQALVSGICYGGLNVALSVPAMAGGLATSKERRHAALLVMVVLGVMLFLGNALMLRHPEVMHVPLPLVQLLRGYGMGGYRLCAGTLYLAVLTTYLAALKGLKALCGGVLRRFVACQVAVTAVALLGFTRIVDVVYPLLGGLCFLLMVLAAVRDRKG